MKKKLIATATRPRTNRKSTATVREFARRFGISRDAVEKILEGLPFELGPNNAHLYDIPEAERLLSDASRATSEIKRLRLEKLQTDLELSKQKAADYNREHISIEDHFFVMETMWKAIWGAIRDSRFLPYPQEMEIGIRVQRALISAMREIGLPESDIKPWEREVTASEKKFSEDLKAGRIPNNWFDPYQAENKCRVWSQDLGRYYTKKEIIAKFGPGAQISPIDEILDEVAEAESDSFQIDNGSNS